MLRKNQENTRNWRDVEKFFASVLQSDGYSKIEVQELSFIISQILEDASPLLDAFDERNTEISNQDRDSILEQLHMLFNNHEIVVDGYNLLMRDAKLKDE